MARVVSYEIEVRGIRGVIQNQNDLTAAVKATREAYKDADFGTDEFRQGQKELTKLTNLQKELRADARQTAREQQIAADKNKGSYRSLNAELVNLRNRFKDLSAEQREAFGPQILSRINELDKELKEIDASMGNYQRNVGNYGSALADLGGIDIASLATVPGAIVAVGTAAIDAGKFVLELTDRFRELRGEVSNLVEGTDGEIDNFTARIAAISETFGESTDQILNSANSVSKTLEISFGEALDRIEEGFIAGSNQTGEFLQNLQEYPTFFDEANLSADALFRTINQQVTQGLFSDKGVDAIKEATIRLRELPTAAIDGLNAIGIEAEEVTDLIGREGIGAAIALVSSRLGELEADSPEVGRAVAGIFGGAGEDAGIAFLASIEDIINGTGSLIDATNEYQLQQQRALEVNREFAAVQVEVANALGGAGASFDNLGTIIRTKALQVLLFFIDRARDMFEATAPLRESLTELARTLGLIGSEGTLVDAILFGINKTVEVSQTAFEFFNRGLSFVVDRFNDIVSAGQQFLSFLGLIDEGQEAASESASRMAGANGRLGGSIGQTAEESKSAKTDLDSLIGSINKTRDATNEAAVATDAFAKDSIAGLRDEVNKLKKELDSVGVDGQAAVLSRLLDAEAALEEAEEFRTKLREQIVAARADIPPIELLDPANESFKREVIFEEEIEFRRDLGRAILDQERDLAAEQAEIRNFLFDSLASANQVLAESSSIRFENEINDLEERYETEIALAEGNEERQEQLRAELAQKREEIQKKEFAAQKRFRVASALSSLAEGIVNILSAPTVIPDPFGAIFKGIRVGVLTGTTALQIANIQKQQAARGKLLPIQRNAIQVLAAGDIINGFFRGPSHSDPSGGIPTILNGQPVLVEGNEFSDLDEFGGVAVVNKRSSSIFRRELASMRGVSFPGKRAVLSGINSYRNYGIPFAAEGALLSPNLTSLLSGSASQPGRIEVTFSDHNIDRLASATGESVATGAMRGVGVGLGQENRRMERESMLNDKTGV